MNVLFISDISNGMNETDNKTCLRPLIHVRSSEKMLSTELSRSILCQFFFQFFEVMTENKTSRDSLRIIHERTYRIH